MVGVSKTGGNGGNNFTVPPAVTQNLAVIGGHSAGVGGNGGGGGTLPGGMDHASFILRAQTDAVPLAAQIETERGVNRAATTQVDSPAR